MAGAMTGATRKACIIRFDSQIKGVIGEYEKVNRLNEIVKGLDVEASAYAYVDSAENIEYDELTKIQERRENIDKEIALYCIDRVGAERSSCNYPWFIDQG